MSSEQNKAIVQRWFAEMINTNNLGIAEELIDTHYVNHFLPGQTGPDVERQIMTLFFSAFPDLQGTVEDLFAEGDRVAVRLMWRGTNSGSFNGMPPTDKQVAFSTTNIFRLVNGKIAENWPQVDMMGLMQQLGAIAASQAG